MHQAESYVKDSKAFIVRTARVLFSDVLTPHAAVRCEDSMMVAPHLYVFRQLLGLAREFPAALSLVGGWQRSAGSECALRPQTEVGCRARGTG